MFASQMSDQKNPSGYKSYSNQVPENISIMTLKMVSQIKLSADKQQAQYEGIPLTYISIMARKEDASQVQQKGQFTINDDTGTKQFFIQIGGDIDREIFNVICNDEDEPRTCYYIFLFRVRINKDMIIFDIQSIKRIQETAQIIYHLANLMTQRLRLHKNQKSINPTLNSIIEEVPFKQNDLPMSEKILNFIRAEVSERGNIPINQQYIITKFADHSSIQEIKKSLADLIQNGSLQQGQGINTYILAD